MNKKKAALLYTIIFLILFIAFLVYFISLLMLSLPASISGWEKVLYLISSVFSLLILFVAGFGIYLSVAYFLFYSPKSILKTLWNIGALLFSLILSAGIAYICIQLQ